MVLVALSMSLNADAKKKEYTDEPAPAKSADSAKRVKPKAATKVRASVKKIKPSE